MFFRFYPFFCKAIFVALLFVIFSGDAFALENTNKCMPFEKPAIAIVFDDLGHHSNTMNTINLPAPMTMSFLPNSGSDLIEQAELASEKGHEVILHLPMEPFDENQPLESGTLQVGMSPQDIRTRLRDGLDRFHGFMGVNNHMGSKFTSDPSSMSALMSAVSDYRGVYFLDSVTSAHSIGEETANIWDVPSTSRDVFLDHAGDERGVEYRLNQAMRTARSKGTAIAIGHPHKHTVDVVDAWLKKNEWSVNLVTVSQVIEHRENCQNQIRQASSK